ncbi:MAG: restriction endonuclease [Anaerolineae bacterium]|nr:restriction endonuclease [Anaerolineae bacterium]
MPPFLDYDPDAIDPEEQARLELGPYYEPPATRAARRKRIVRKRRRWRRYLVLITVAWVFLYVPFALAWIITGRRPLDFVFHLLPSAWLWDVWAVHTLAVVGGWGWLWGRAEWLRRQRRKRLREARTLAQLLQLTPSEFEEWTGELFRRHGYRVVNTPDTADHGIDLLVYRDGERGVVQCKRYRGTVGEPIVRDLFGVIMHDGADRGYLVTTGHISRQARRWARGRPIELIDGERLVQLAME